MPRAAGVYGDKDLSFALRGLALRVTSGQVNQARRNALRPTLEAPKAHLQINKSVHRGKLIKGLVIADKGPSRSVVTAKGDAVRIAHLVEFGTAPWLLHPGARPKPYLRPAFEETKGLVVESFGKAVQLAVVLGLKNG